MKAAAAVARALSESGWTRTGDNGTEYGMYFIGRAAYKNARGRCDFLDCIDCNLLKTVLL